MATHERNNLRDEYHYVSSGQILQNVHLVWVDATIDENTPSTMKTLKQFHAIVNDMSSFKEIDGCVEYLNGVKKEKVLVITSGSLGQELVKQIHPMKQIETIFIFCGNKSRHESWAQQWYKIKGVYECLKPLCKDLEDSVRQVNHDLTPISFVTQRDAQDPEIDLNRLDPSFMYTQLFKKLALEMKYEENEREVLIKRYQMLYTNDDDKRAIVDEFNRDYQAKDAIHWYTRETFLYKILNRALRLLECDIIVEVLFFINDLHRQLEEVHRKQLDRYEGKPFTLYRGQRFDQEDFNKLKKSFGGLLSFNSFLSTTTDKKVPLRFAEDPEKDDGKVGVIFVITIDPEIPGAIFADIKEYSEFNESEVLFSMHTVFRIGKIQPRVDNQRIYQVELTLTGEDDADLRSLMDKIDQELTGETGHERLGDLLVHLERLDKAEELYNKLLEKNPSDRQRASYYHYMGMIKDKQRRYDESIKYYTDAIELKETILPATDRLLAVSYNNLGMVHSKKGDHDEALKWYQKDLDICEKTLPANHHDLATCYNNMGEVYENKGDYAKALSYYEKDLAICKEVLPSNHPDIATSYNNIGSLYVKQNEFSKALEYYEKALSIRKKSLPHNHLEIGGSYNNIAWLHRSKGDFEQALIYYERALKIWEQTLAPNHHYMIDVDKSITEMKKRLRKETTVAT